MAPGALCVSAQDTVIIPVREPDPEDLTGTIGCIFDQSGGSEAQAHDPC